MAFDTSGKEIGIVATAIENEVNRIGKQLATPPAKILPRPTGKRPKRLDGNPTTCKPWIDYEDAIFHYVDGFNVSAGKCWDDQARKSAMQEVGVDGFSEFNKIHKRTKKRQSKASKK